MVEHSFHASFLTFQVHLRLIADDQTSTMIVHKAGSFQDWCVGEFMSGLWDLGFGGLGVEGFRSVGCRTFFQKGSEFSILGFRG